MARRGNRGQPCVSKNKYRRHLPNLLIFRAPMLDDPIQALAVIDGALCRLDRFGARGASCSPLGSAVAEFLRGPFCTYVREQPYGFLPGFSNLYCLDGDGRLLWIAEWPVTDDPCAAILAEHDGILEVRSMRGAHVRLDAHDGHLVDWSQPVAAAV